MGSQQGEITSGKERSIVKSQVIKVHIKAVISTAGNDEEYVGRHLGDALLDRPLSKTVVTFEEDVTEPEFDRLQLAASNTKIREQICKQLFIGQAIKGHSFSVTRNILH